VRSRDRHSLNAEIEEGAASTVLVHLANISYRLGRTIHFEPDTMTIKDDAEATRMMTRKYRPPFIVPEKV
jgi:Oxidoreductase family, C-terminal alpha/beta domain